MAVFVGAAAAQNAARQRREREKQLKEYQDTRSLARGSYYETVKFTMLEKFYDEHSGHANTKVLSVGENGILVEDECGTTLLTVNTRGEYREILVEPSQSYLAEQARTEKFTNTILIVVLMLFAAVCTYCALSK